MNSIIVKFNKIDNVENLTKYKPYFLSAGRLDKIKNFIKTIRTVTKCQEYI